MDNSRAETVLAIGRTRRREFIVILGALTAFAPLSIDMYLPALPAIAHDFAVPIGSAEHTLAAFFLGFSLGQAFFGPLADRFGRKLPLLAGYFSTPWRVSVARSASISARWSFCASRRVWGACTGAVIARACVRDLFPPGEAARIFSYMMLVFGVVPAAGAAGRRLCPDLDGLARDLLAAGCGRASRFHRDHAAPAGIPRRRRARHASAHHPRRLLGAAGRPALHRLRAGRRGQPCRPVRLSDRRAARLHRPVRHSAAEFRLVLRRQRRRDHRGLADHGARAAPLSAPDRPCGLAIPAGGGRHRAGGSGDVGHRRRVEHRGLPVRLYLIDRRDHADGDGAGAAFLRRHGRHGGGAARHDPVRRGRHRGDHARRPFRRRRLCRWPR